MFHLPIDITKPSGRRIPRTSLRPIEILFDIYLNLSELFSTILFIYIRAPTTRKKIILLNDEIRTVQGFRWKLFFLHPWSDVTKLLQSFDATIRYGFVDGLWYGESEIRFAMALDNFNQNLVNLMNLMKRFRSKFDLILLNYECSSSIKTFSFIYHFSNSLSTWT